MKSQMNTVTDKHTTRSLIRLHDADNVLIARAQLALGQQIDIAGATVRLRSQPRPTISAPAKLGWRT